MGVVFTVESNYAKEMRRHEAYPTQFGPPGRPYVYQHYPLMLYRASRGPNGPEASETCIVNDERERDNMISRGFWPTQELALAELDRQHTEHGKLAAERNYEIAHGRISEKAATEVRAAEAAHGATHLPEVKEQPRRGRPRKQTTVPV